MKISIITNNGSKLERRDCQNGVPFGAPESENAIAGFANKMSASEPAEGAGCGVNPALISDNSETALADSET